jgi:predicted metal-dependent peptidase
MNARAKIDYALRQVVIHHGFFGPAVMAMPWTEDTRIDTACTNGTVVRYNPSFVDGLTKAQTVGLVIHELCHPLLGHLERLAIQFKTDHRRTNAAADYELNGFITSYNKDAAIPVILPPDGCIDVDKWGEVSAEVIFKKLEMPDIPPPPPPRVNPDGEVEVDGDGDDDGGGGGGDNDGDNDGGRGGRGGRGGSSAGEFEIPNDTESRELNNKWRELLGSCIQTSKLRGELGGDFQKKLEGLYETPLSLEDILSKYVTEFCIGDGSTKPDRKFLALHDICIAGIEDERHGTLVFVRDTSCSMDDKTMSSVTSVVQQACDELDFEKIVVIDADAQVCDTVEYSPFDTISLDYKGGGGTSFRPALKHVEDNIEDARVVIYLTDGYGDFPDHEPSTPTLWVTYGLSESHFPFGDVISLSEILKAQQ